MINTLESKFSFFKAGQGAFYGGIITNPENKKQYSIVYDCGTVSKRIFLQEEIKEFKTNYSRNGIIDLLFISHLDWDHVSGMKQLLTEFDVKRIILPYLIKSQRLPSLLAFAENAPINEGDFKDYSLFLKSPWNYTREHSENTDIILIDPNKDDKYLNYNNENLSDEIYAVGTPIEDLDDYNEINNTSNLYLYKNNLQFFIENKWEFTTHVKNVEEDNISKLYTCLKKLLNKNIQDELNYDDIANILINNPKKAVSKSKKINAKSCYSLHIGNVNRYGLVLLHGPINYRVLNSVVSESNNNTTPYCYHVESSRLYTLLLGDSNIKDEDCKELIKRFKDKLKNVHIFQVPHHGSKNNWNTKVFDNLDIGTKCQSPNSTFAVCNFGDSFKLKYPCQDIKNKFESNLLLNTEFNRVTINYDIHYSNTNPINYQCSYCLNKHLNISFDNTYQNFMVKKWYNID